MKMVLIEKHSAYIENAVGVSADFSDLDDLIYHAPELDLSGLVGWTTNYEPERGMHTRFNGINTAVLTVPDALMESLISSVSALAARKADILYRLTEEDAYARALSIKLAELDSYRDFNKNVANYYFTWDNGDSHWVYVDDTSIEKMLTVCRNLDDQAPVITQGGLWKTADVDGVDNVYVETSVGELRRMRDEMIVRGLQNWGYCDAHKKIIKAALNNKTMTPRQILDYDAYKTNWSLS